MSIEGIDSLQKVDYGYWKEIIAKLDQEEVVPNIAYARKVLELAYADFDEIHKTADNPRLNKKSVELIKIVWLLEDIQDVVQDSSISPDQILNILLKRLLGTIPTVNNPELDQYLLKGYLAGIIAFIRALVEKDWDKLLDSEREVLVKAGFVQSPPAPAAVATTATAVPTAPVERPAPKAEAIIKPPPKAQLTRTQLREQSANENFRAELEELERKLGVSILTMPIYQILGLSRPDEFEAMIHPISYMNISLDGSRRTLRTLSERYQTFVKSINTFITKYEKRSGLTPDQKQELGFLREFINQVRAWVGTDIANAINRDLIQSQKVEPSPMVPNWQYSGKQFRTLLESDIEVNGANKKIQEQLDPEFLEMMIEVFDGAREHYFGVKGHPSIRIKEFENIIDEYNRDFRLDKVAEWNRGIDQVLLESPLDVDLAQRYFALLRRLVEYDRRLSDSKLINQLGGRNTVFVSEAMKVRDVLAKAGLDVGNNLGQLEIYERKLAGIVEKRVEKIANTNAMLLRYAGDVNPLRFEDQQAQLVKILSEFKPPASSNEVGLEGVAGMSLVIIDQIGELVKEGDVVGLENLLDSQDNIFVRIRPQPLDTNRKKALVAALVSLAVHGVRNVGYGQLTRFQIDELSALGVNGPFIEVDNTFKRPKFQGLLIKKPGQNIIKDVRRRLENRQRQDELGNTDVSKQLEILEVFRKAEGADPKKEPEKWLAFFGKNIGTLNQGSIAVDVYSSFHEAENALAAMRQDLELGVSSLPIDEARLSKWEDSLKDALFALILRDLRKLELVATGRDVVVDPISLQTVSLVNTEVTRFDQEFSSIDQLQGDTKKFDFFSHLVDLDRTMASSGLEPSFTEVVVDFLDLSEAEVMYINDRREEFAATARAIYETRFAKIDKFNNLRARQSQLNEAMKKDPIDGVTLVRFLTEIQDDWAELAKDPEMQNDIRVCLDMSSDLDRQRAALQYLDQKWVFEEPALESLAKAQSALDKIKSRVEDRLTVSRSFRLLGQRNSSLEGFLNKIILQQGANLREVYTQVLLPSTKEVKADDPIYSSVQQRVNEILIGLPVDYGLSLRSRALYLLSQICGHEDQQRFNLLARTRDSLKNQFTSTTTIPDTERDFRIVCDVLVKILNDPSQRVAPGLALAARNAGIEVADNMIDGSISLIDVSDIDSNVDDIKIIESRYLLEVPSAQEVRNLIKEAQRLRRFYTQGRMAYEDMLHTINDLVMYDRGDQWRLSVSIAGQVVWQKLVNGQWQEEELPEVISTELGSLAATNIPLLPAPQKPMDKQQQAYVPSSGRPFRPSETQFGNVNFSTQLYNALIKASKGNRENLEIWMNAVQPTQEEVNNWEVTLTSLGLDADDMISVLYDQKGQELRIFLNETNVKRRLNTDKNPKYLVLSRKRVAITFWDTDEIMVASELTDQPISSVDQDPENLGTQREAQTNVDSGAEGLELVSAAISRISGSTIGENIADRNVMQQWETGLEALGILQGAINSAVVERSQNEEGALNIILASPAVVNNLQVGGGLMRVDQLALHADGKVSVVEVNESSGVVGDAAVTLDASSLAPQDVNDTPTFESYTQTKRQLLLPASLPEREDGNEALEVSFNFDEFKSTAAKIVQVLVSLGEDFYPPGDKTKENYQFPFLSVSVVRILNKLARRESIFPLKTLVGDILDIVSDGFVTRLSKNITREDGSKTTHSYLPFLSDFKGTELLSKKIDIAARVRDFISELSRFASQIEELEQYVVKRAGNKQILKSVSANLREYVSNLESELDRSLDYEDIVDGYVEEK